MRRIEWYRAVRSSTAFARGPECASGGVSGRAVTAGVAAAAAAVVGASESKKCCYRFMSKELHDMHCSCNENDHHPGDNHFAVFQAMTVVEFEGWKGRHPSCGGKCMHRKKYQSSTKALRAVKQRLWRENNRQKGNGNRE